MRFNYMIPVPDKCLTKLDFKDSSMFSEKEKILLQKEYKYCKSKQSQIQKLAIKTYNQVNEGKNEVLNRNSCVFKLLENACKDYK